ncbi:MAG: hypothetical protein AAB289_08550 [Chloroflexota bacterium]
MPRCVSLYLLGNVALPITVGAVLQAKVNSERPPVVYVTAMAVPGPVPPR